jgi:hypothetical protein
VTEAVDAPGDGEPDGERDRSDEDRDERSFVEDRGDRFDSSTFAPFDELAVKVIAARTFTIDRPDNGCSISDGTVVQTTLRGPMGDLVA